MTTLGERVKMQRKALGLTQEELGKQAGISQEAVSRIENGKIEGRSVTTVNSLARALRVETAWLRGEINGVPPRVVETDPMPLVDADDSGSPLETALGHAFDAERHVLKDLDNVRRVLRSTAQFQTESTDLVDAARAWLDAAAGLRREGRHVSVESLMFRLTLGRKPMAHELDAFESRKDQFRKEIEATVRAHGLEPGQARDLGKAILDGMRKLMPKDRVEGKE